MAEAVDAHRRAHVLPGDQQGWSKNAREVANSYGVSAEVRVECNTLAGGEQMSTCELRRLACEALTNAGFEPHEIVCARLNDTRTACFVEVSLAAGEAGDTTR